MLSINSNVVNELIIDKSRFISFLFRVDSIQDINKNIDYLRLKYKDCTHICYAYILDNIKRFNDDGEPQGTAGMPILNVLESNNLNHVLCCVVRYFGGIKLGAGGLVRAYSNSCSEVLGLTDIIGIVSGKICSISFSYDNTKIINSILSNYNIIDKCYGEVVSYKFMVCCEEIDSIRNDLVNYGEFVVLDDCYIEKDF